VCDLSEAALAKITGIFAAHGRPAPAAYRNYRDLLASDAVQAVMIPTSWNAHLPIAADAMKAGKYAAFEVGGASSTEELWQLVHASEQTGTPCMMLENCCYARNELMVLNMVRQGLFGELVHCEGGYEHDLREGDTLLVEAEFLAFLRSMGKVIAKATVDGVVAAEGIIRFALVDPPSAMVP
jgi:predicted dehydrogenase